MATRPGSSRQAAATDAAMAALRTPVSVSHVAAQVRPLYATQLAHDYTVRADPTGEWAEASSGSTEAELRRPVIDAAGGAVPAAAAVLVASAVGWLTGRALSRRSAFNIAMFTTTANRDVEYDYDALIARMIVADDQTLKVMVEENIPALKPPFFMKLDQVGSAAPSPEAKQRYEALGDRVLHHMKAVVEAAQDKVREQGVRVTRLVGIFTEEDGSIKTPLQPDKVARLREVVRQELAAMSTDVFLNTCLAFMSKAGQDKKADMLEVLQRILQAYAAESLLIMCPHGGEGAQPENIMVWNMLLTTEFDQWEGILRREFFSPGGKDLDSFVQMLDEGVGAIVHEQTKGGIQQLLAQYVYQIMTRINALKGEPAPAARA